MKIKLKQRQNILLLLIMLAVLLFASEVAAESLSLDKRVITMPEKWLTSADQVADLGTIVPLFTQDRTLEGLTDEVEAYYEIPIQGVEKGSQLHLQLEYSELLLKDSTLTVEIDDVPQKSIQLKQDKRKMNVSISLTDEALTAGFHTIKLTFYGDISENLCSNLENPANWLTIIKGSHVYLTSKDVVKRTGTLTEYPYPFIQRGRDQSVEGMIVIPNDPSTAILSAALKLANELNKEAGESQQVRIVTESDVTKIATHLIVVGTKDQWQGVIKDLYETANLSLKADELLLSSYFMSASDVLKQLLFVTAEDDQLIEDNIAILTEPALIPQLSGDELSLKQLPHLPELEVKQHHDFTDLRIPSQTLTGKYKASTQFFFDLPGYIDVNKQATLHLKMKVSETLFSQIEMNQEREYTELVVLINNIPHSILIDDLKQVANEGFYDVAIPVPAKILGAQPYLTFEFQAYGLSEHDICVPSNDEKWIYLDESSYLDMAILARGNQLYFKSWPAPFYSINGVQDTVIILPDTLEKQTIQELSQLTQSLGKQSSLRGLRLIFEKDVDPAKLTGRHVIVLGGINAHPSLSQFKEKLLLPVDADGQFNVREFEFVQETSQHVAWMQPSVWDESKVMVVFSSLKQDEERHVTKQLLDYLQTTALMTDLVVVNQNGDIFTSDRTEKEVRIPDTTADDATGVKAINSWLFLAFITLFIAGVFLLIGVIRARKKRRTPKKHAEKTDEK